MSDCGTIDNSRRRDLPPEMVAHVLSHLPVKSLCRFKCVSPSWNSLISSPQFAKTHLRITTNKPQNNILISNSKALYSVDLAAANPTAEKAFSFRLFELSHISVQVSGSCNGLVLVSDLGHGNSNFLLNPSTRECKKLPESPIFDNSSSARIKFVPYETSTHTFLPGLGYDSSSDDYKVVMLLYHIIVDTESDFDGDVNSITDVTVYSLKIDSWRRIQDCHYKPVQPFHGVLFNERLHWLTSRTGYLDGSMVIAAFNLSDEIFKDVHLPVTFHNSEFKFGDYHMVVLGGCLCLVIWPTVRDKIAVWMMKKYGVQESWIKYTIATHGMSLGNVLYFSSEDEFVLRAYGNCVKLVVYSLKKEALRDIVVGGLPTEFIDVGNYIETLVSPNHGRLIRRQCKTSSGECSKSYQNTG
ncbi:F-box/kelch-repeat protein At3g06240-like [Rhododendron vialii]|uniref:F-box/kelch-repeat protein At3g06240-like n=1 Tax=Rhododendron vialii TaxID=182163 RepID=UPI00265F2D6E|nr:F-box/kelch-repeat protein At3g06240-like [Rhododendron vialii]